MITAKASQLARDLEIARCKGNWNAIPDLARKYKKYNGTGQGMVTRRRQTEYIFLFLFFFSVHFFFLITEPVFSVLEQTVLVEATIGQLTNISESKATNGIVHQHDDPDSIACECRLKDEQVRPLLQQLESVLQTQDDSVTESEKEVS